MFEVTFHAGNEHLKRTIHAGNEDSKNTNYDTLSIFWSLCRKL